MKKIGTTKKKKKKRQCTTNRSMQQTSQQKKSCILLILGEQLHNIFVEPYHLQLVSIIPFDCCNCGRGGQKKKNHNLIMLCVSLFQDCGLMRKTELAVIMKQVSGRKPMTRYFRLTSKEWIRGTASSRAYSPFLARWPPSLEILRVD